MRIKITTDRTCRDITKKVEYDFYISEEEYREFFGALCAGVDTGKFNVEDETIRKFGSVEEVLSGGE